MIMSGLIETRVNQKHIHFIGKTLKIFIYKPCQPRPILSKQQALASIAFYLQER